MIDLLPPSVSLYILPVSLPLIIIPTYPCLFLYYLLCEHVKLHMLITSLIYGPLYTVLHDIFLQGSSMSLWSLPLAWSAGALRGGMVSLVGLGLAGSRWWL